MKHGIVLSTGSVDQLIDLARAAEQAGWDGVFTWDAISVAPIPTWDPWTVLGAIARETDRVTLGAFVFSLARRKPWEVARQALTVDHLSHGRLVLPVALGATQDAGYNAVNTDTTDPRVRGQRLDECLAFLDHAWTAEPFTFDGEQYQTGEMTFLPAPVQRPRIPVWCVAPWPRETSIARALRWDGLIAQLSPEMTATPELVTDITTRAAEREDTGGPYEIVMEGESEPTDADRERLSALADAGLTWWMESRFGPHVTVESLMERIEAGPARG